MMEKTSLLLAKATIGFGLLGGLPVTSHAQVAPGIFSGTRLRVLPESP